ncbi:MAG: hypothetical protein ACI9X0_001848 [Kiritimatiellia bacterium]|jgi:hypothetical protein
MRAYLQISNLKRSIILGGIVALAAAPRIFLADQAVAVLVPSAFLLMTLVAGAVFAWGSKGGMVGAFPERSVMQRGLCVAVVLGVVGGVARMVWGDDQLREVLEQEGSARAFELGFPADVPGKIALVLWCAGFQVLFLQAGTMAFLTRILRRWEFALITVGFGRVFVTHLQFAEMGVTPIVSMYLFGTLATLVGATLFARGGFLAAVVFAILLEMRVLLP